LLQDIVLVTLLVKMARFCPGISSRAGSWHEFMEEMRTLVEDLAEKCPEEFLALAREIGREDM